MNNMIRFTALFVVWLASFVFGWLHGGMTAWFLFYSSSVILLYLLSFQLLTLHCLKTHVVTRHERYVAGDDVHIVTQLEQQSWFPLLWLAIEIEWSNDTLSRIQKHRQLIFPWMRSSIVMRSELKSVHRGVYRLASLRVLTGDVFGMTKKMRQMNTETSFIVYPKPLPLLPGLMMSQAEVDSSNSLKVSPSQIISGIRDYQPGDAMNRIHWKSSARTMSLKTKELSTSSDHRMMVFLDAYRSSVNNTIAAALFEKNVQVAASLIQWADEHDYMMGFACGSQQVCSIPVTSQFAHEQCNTILADVRRDGTLPLNEAVLNEASNIQEHTILMCVTSDLNDQLLDLAYKLKYKRVKFGVVLTYMESSLSWHQQYVKQRLEAIDCPFYSIQYADTALLGQGGAVYAGA